MKKLFAIAAVVAVALTSCVKNEVITPAGEIAFKDYTLSSKALILPGEDAEKALPTTCTFGAYALYTGQYELDDTDAAPDAIYVDDLEVSYDGTQWAYNTAQYWPTDENDKLDFYAYYPYNASVGEWDAVNNCVRFHGAELGTTLNNQTDWMVSTPTTGHNYTSSATGVPVVFNHVTSMIVFKAADITPEARYQNLVTINSITVKNAAYKGDFTTVAGTPATPTWTSVYAGSRTDVEVFNAGQAITTTVADVTKATVDGGALIVVPETIPNGTTFVVNYSIAESADHVIAEVVNKDITINVNTLGTTVWEPGKKYVYTINFDLIGGINEGLHEITFVPTVSPWDEVAGGSYEI